MLQYSREFEVFATYLNFTQAARKLNVSQSCLSRHISDLERELGFQLVERNPVALTPAGACWLSGFGAIDKQIHALQRRCHEVAGTAGCKLSVAVVPFDCSYANSFYWAFAQLAEEFPSFSYSFDTDRATTVEEDVASGATDVGLVFCDPVDLPEGMAFQKLTDDVASGWVRQDSPVAGRTIKPEELSSLAFVGFSNRKMKVYELGTARVWHELGLEVNTRAKNIDSITEALVSLDRDEVIFISDRCGDMRKYNPRLCKVDLDLPSPFAYSVNLIYRIDNPNPACHRFIELACGVGTPACVSPA